MRKTMLLGVIIVAIAMILGAQSTLAAKPDSVTGVAKGQVRYANFSGFNVNGAASGPWNLVLHLDENTINFIATCQTSVGIVKVSSIGPAAWSYDKTTDTVTITGLSFTVKNAGVVMTYTGKITVNPSELKVNFGSPGPTGAVNIKGNVRLFKGVP